MKEKEMNKSILVAMSGGVDSSVAAYLLKNQGYDVKGAILRMHDDTLSETDIVNGKLPAAIWYAREAARRLKLDFNIVDVRQEFDDRMTDFLVRANENGTASDADYYDQMLLQIPCLLQAAEKLGCSTVATGHHAIIEYDEEKCRYILKKSGDAHIDQSYKLYRLSQEELSKIITPLGALDESEIKKTACSLRFKSTKAEDGFCFISDEKRMEFLAKHLRKLSEGVMPANRIPGLVPGNFVDRDGRVLGKHKGFLYYTVGSRDDLNDAAAENLFVCEKREETNEILLTGEEELYKDKVRADRVNFVSIPELPPGGMRVTARLKHRAEEYPGTAVMLEDKSLEVTFDKPVRAPIPGHSMVIYDGDLLIAGGIITQQREGQ